MSTDTAAPPANGAPAPSNSPFAQPVPDTRRAADAGTAKQNAEVVRPDLAEARRVADQTPTERFLDHRDGVTTNRERIGERKLSAAEYDKLTYSEKIEYANRQTAAKAPQREDGTAKDAATDEPKHKIGDIEVTESELRGLLERKGLEESRKAALPADPSEYRAALPDNFVVPPGMEMSFDEKGETMRLAREFAHAQGFDQGQFSGMLSIYAAEKLKDANFIREAAAAERSKLGATGTQRVTAIQTFLKGHLGDEIAKPFMNTLATAGQVKGWEIIMGKLANGGFTVPGFSHSNRGPDDARPRLSDADYNAMSYTQKKAYAEAASAPPTGRRQ